MTKIERRIAIAAVIMLSIGSGTSKANSVDPAVRMAATASASLVVTAQGIGNLNARTPYREDALRDALPGYELKKSTRGTGQDQFDLFEYYRQDKLAVEVYPDADQTRVLSIVVLDRAIVAPKNARVGTSYRNLVQGKSGFACSPGAEAADKQVICLFKDARRLKYVFALPDWKGSAETMPPKELLNRATLIKVAVVF